jgi:hypothetical protein
LSRQLYALDPYTQGRQSFAIRLEIIKALAGAGPEASYAYYGYQPPERRSFAEAAGDFAFDAVLNSELIQQSYEELSNPDFGSAAGVGTFITAGVGIIVGPIDAAANLATLGGKGAVEGTVKAGLKEALEIGVKESAAPLFSRTAGQAMDPALFQRIQTAFERQPGRMMLANENSALELNKHSRPGLRIEGETLNENVVFLRPNPSTSSVYEELIHTAQLRGGMTDRLQMEIEAAQKLIRFGDRYHIPQAETEATAKRLLELQETLRRRTQ